VVSGFSFTLGKLGELSDLKLPWLDRSRHLDFQLSGLTRGPRRHSAGSMDLMADTYAVTPRRAIRSPWPRGKSAARSGSRRKAFIRACATRFMLHPINSAQSRYRFGILFVPRVALRSRAPVFDRFQLTQAKQS
jgi:hypothetical protein